MKTLYILRHAKSSWDNSDLADYDRPLNDRGRAAAPSIGDLMKREALRPEVIVASPARRALETAELVKKSAGIEREIEFNEHIYEASVQTLRGIVASINEQFDSAMIVGHNPGMEGLVRVLTGHTERMPTAALAIIDLDIAAWDQLAASSGRLRRLIRPKDEMKDSRG